MRLLQLIQSRCADWQQSDAMEQLKETAMVLSPAFLAPNSAVRRAALHVMASFPVQLESKEDNATEVLLSGFSPAAAGLGLRWSIGVFRSQTHPRMGG